MYTAGSFSSTRGAATTGAAAAALRAYEAKLADEEDDGSDGYDDIGSSGGGKYGDDGYGAAAAAARSSGGGGGGGGGGGRVVSRGGARGAPGGLVGLHNMGNTCFMNSCLQCLSNVAPLTAYFVGDAWRDHLNRSAGKSRGEAAIAYADLMRRMWRPGADGAERPAKVKSVVGTLASRFLGFDQQDAGEFLRFFVDALASDTNRIRGKPPYRELDERPEQSDEEVSRVWWDNHLERNASAVADLFAGQLKTVVECRRCGRQSRAFDPAWDLAVQIPTAAQVRAKFAPSSYDDYGASGACSLGDCLRAFTAPEVLSGTEALYCSRCASHQPAVKAEVIFRLPPVLVIVIKRFTFSAFRRTKLSTPIDFPITGMDMAPYCAPTSPFIPPGSTLYDLVGVSNHSGSLGGGHYTACVARCAGCVLFLPACAHTPSAAITPRTAGTASMPTTASGTTSTTRTCRPPVPAACRRRAPTSCSTSAGGVDATSTNALSDIRAWA